MTTYHIVAKDKNDVWHDLNFKSIKEAKKYNIGLKQFTYKNTTRKIK